MGIKEYSAVVAGGFFLLTLSGIGPRQEAEKTNGNCTAQGNTSVPCKKAEESLPLYTVGLVGFAVLGSAAGALSLLSPQSRRSGYLQLH